MGWALGCPATQESGERERQTQKAIGGSTSGYPRSERRLRGKTLAPQVKRGAIGKMIEGFDLSERYAYGLVGLSRDSYRHPPVADQATVALNVAIIDIAWVRRRFGYRRIHDLLRPEFPDVNQKRVYRLYSAARLAVKERRKAKQAANQRADAAADRGKRQ